MSQHSDEVRFRHMLDHAREALVMVQDKNRLDLDNNRMLSSYKLKVFFLIENIWH